MLCHFSLCWMSATLTNNSIGWIGDSILNLSVFLMFFYCNLHDYFIPIITNAGGCLNTSLAKRLLASRSAFWGTAGTTVLLCRNSWDSCKHKWTHGNRQTDVWGFFFSSIPKPSGSNGESECRELPVMWLDECQQRQEVRHIAEQNHMSEIAVTIQLYLHCVSQHTSLKRPVNYWTRGWLM